MVTFASTAPAATTSKSTSATLTRFVGPSRRTFWNADTMVEPLANVPASAVGELANSVVLPPLTSPIVTTLGS
jgi:hypothetical protein